MLAVFDPSPIPFIALMGVGFVVGAAGHLYGSRALVGAGIAMIFLATVLLPLLIYLTDD